MKMPNMLHLERYLDKVSTFGVDIDTKDFFTYRATIQTCEQFGRVIDMPSNHGWHFKVYLPREVTLGKSFEMRYHCGDDYHRLVRDMIKAMNGFRVIDVLFDRKDIKRESIIE